MFIKTIKDPRKVERIRNYVSKSKLYVFLDVAKFADFQWKNADVGRSQGMCHVIYCRIYVTDFREGGQKAPRPPICKNYRTQSYQALHGKITGIKEIEYSVGNRAACSKW